MVEALREAILGTDREIGEEIKWNAPSFFYAGPMKPFNPKEYKRYIVVFNLYRKNCIRLVFPSGAKIGDKTGLLEGDYSDGRRLAFFSSIDDVMTKRPATQAAIRKWLKLLDRYSRIQRSPPGGRTSKVARMRQFAKVNPTSW